MIGTHIGVYRVLQQIGEGGMGSVWLAEHLMLGRQVAIKVLHREASLNPDVVMRFFNEARAATAISDPGIIQIFDFGHHSDGSAFIVMELLRGEPLDQRLRRLGKLPLNPALRILRQVATSLGAAHERGIVHRDVKPENIFLVRDSEVVGGERTKVLDFGIAKLSAEHRVKTQTSVVMGTPIFMSPEQCRGAGQVDRRSDVYSMGCVLFTLLTGRPPFEAEGAGEIIAMHLREPAPPPSRMVAGIPHQVDALVLRCLAKDRTERFDSGSDLAAALTALIDAFAETALAAAPPRRFPSVFDEPPPSSPAPADVAMAPKNQAAMPLGPIVGPPVARAASSPQDLRMSPLITPLAMPLARHVPAPPALPESARTADVSGEQRDGAFSTTLSNSVSSSVASPSGFPSVAAGSSERSKRLSRSIWAAVVGLVGVSGVGWMLRPAEQMAASPAPAPVGAVADLTEAGAAAADAAIAAAVDAASVTDGVGLAADAGAAPIVAALADAAPPAVPDERDLRPDQAVAKIRAVLQAFARWVVTPAAGPGAACPTIEQLGPHLDGGDGKDPWNLAIRITCREQPRNQQVGAISAGPDGRFGSADDVKSWTLGNEVSAQVRGPRWSAPKLAPPATDTSPKDKGQRPRDPAKKPNPGSFIDLDGDGIPDQR